MKKIYGLIFLILLLLLTACGNSTEEKWQEQYDLGMQYLIDGDYEAAIVAFTAAIEIDAKESRAYIERGDTYILLGETEENLAAALADYEIVLNLYEEVLASGEVGISEELSVALVQAYLGIADVYIRQGNYDSALEILREGLEKTRGSEEIALKIEEIEAGTIIDSSGNVRRESSYDGEGTLLWYYEYAYQEDGLQASVTSYDGSGNQTGHVDMEYDDDGRKIVTYYSRGDIWRVEKVEIVYDSSGYTSQEIYYDSNDIFESLLYECDSDGNIISRIRFDSNGKLIESIYYERDPEGNVIAITCYDSENELKYKEYDEYNNGQLTKRTISYSSGNQYDYLFEYDSLGNVVRESYYTNGKLTKVQETVYDDDGDYIGYRTYDGEGNLTQTVITG